AARRLRPRHDRSSAARRRREGAGRHRADARQRDRGVRRRGLSDAARCGRQGRADARTLIAMMWMGPKVVRWTRSAPSPCRGEGWGEGVTNLSIDPNPLTRLPRFARKSTSPLRGEVTSAALFAAPLLASVLVSTFTTTPAPAQTVEQFYRGRTVAIVVGFATRRPHAPHAPPLAARGLPKYLRGSPNIVVRNMQGAGSVVAANHLYNVSPRDGSELGVIAGSAAIEPVFGSKSVQFDGQKFAWLGSANNEIAGCL